LTGSLSRKWTELTAAGQGTLIHHVAAGRRDAGLRRDFLRATGDGGDGMPAPGKLGDDARAGISGRAGRATAQRRPAKAEAA